MPVSTPALDAIGARALIATTITRLEDLAARLANDGKHAESFDFLRDAADKLDDLLG
jgi:hypothetical protein